MKKMNIFMICTIIFTSLNIPASYASQNHRHTGQPQTYTSIYTDSNYTNSVQSQLGFSKAGTNSNSNNISTHNYNNMHALSTPATINEYKKNGLHGNMQQKQSHNEVPTAHNNNYRTYPSTTANARYTKDKKYRLPTQVTSEYARAAHYNTSMHDGQTTNAQQMNDQEHLNRLLSDFTFRTTKQSQQRAYSPIMSQQHKTLREELNSEKIREMLAQVNGIIRPKEIQVNTMIMQNETNETWYTVTKMLAERQIQHQIKRQNKLDHHNIRSAIVKNVLNDSSN